MLYQTAFPLLNLAVVPAWLMLLFAPRWQLTRTLVHGGYYPAIYCAIYAVFLFNHLFLGAASPGASFTSLEGVMGLFDHPNGILLGWTHYLAFDLFVGAWIGRDALRRGITQWLAAPAMLLTFLLGPVGLLVYLAIRFFQGKARLSLVE
ncbi:MAG: ABA4-like family protein [Hyphomicrobiales bacterium]